MNTPTLHPTPTPSRRRGFTFTEVMFAVVILGIGFIMIAAMFPVAIRQNAQSAEESLAVPAAQKAAASLQQAVLNSPLTLIRPTAPRVLGNIPGRDGYNAPFATLGEAYYNRISPGGEYVLYPWPTTPALSAAQKRTASQQFAARQWVTLRGDLVSTVDSRLGFAVAYSRSNYVSYTGVVPNVLAEPESSARIIMVVAQNRVRPIFNEQDAAPALSTTPASNPLWQMDLRIPTSTTATTPTSKAKHTDYETQYLDFADNNQRTPATLQLKRLGAYFHTDPNGGPDRVTFQNTMANGLTGHYSCVAPGTFVIIADAGDGNPISNSLSTENEYRARANGKVLRVGNQVASTNSSVTFELLPGQDVQSLPRADRPPYETSLTATPKEVEVLVLGRALQDPTSNFDATSNPYVGPAMDIAVYVSTLGLRP